METYARRARHPRRIRAGERVEHFETVRRRKDGTLIDISLTVSPIRGADGIALTAYARVEDRMQAPPRGLPDARP